jgi:hypothetical protein
LRHDWKVFLDDFCRHWPTHLDTVRVEDVRRGKKGTGALRQGDPKWFRVTEKMSRSAKSVFRFGVNGEVAKSTHSGLPWLRFIRQQCAGRVHIWPFDGWAVPVGMSVVAEVYPRLWSRHFPSDGRTQDQQDAFATAAWLKDADANGELELALKPPSAPSERSAGDVEGWILGVGRSGNPPTDDCRIEQHSRSSSIRARGPVAVDSAGWRAIHLVLVAAAHAVNAGGANLVQIARWAVEVAHGAGYVTHPNDRRTRFTSLGITAFQTLLYAFNERSDWRFPDSVLLAGWLAECGGPRMGRGPARADFEANGVQLMIGGTRWRYNNQRYGHGGEGLPTSHEYEPADCAHMEGWGR